MTAAVVEPSLADFVLAASPVIALLVLMIWFGWGADRAGPVVLVLALIVAFLWFGADARLLALSQGKSVLLAIWVLFIVWAALFLYNVVNEAGGIVTIGRGLARFSADRPFQVLLLAWVFTSFLQGIAGYGVPVAVVAPLMVGLGFAPALAVVMTSVGHSWSVTFGSLAASFFVLVGTSGLPASDLSFDSGVVLGVACLLCGAGALLAFGGPRGLRSGLLPLLVTGLVMAVTQLALAEVRAYSLAAFGAGVAGLLTMAAISRLPRYRLVPAGHPAGLPARPVSVGADESPATVREFVRAFAAYGLLVAIVLTVSFIDPLSDALGTVHVELPFPATSTALGWTNAATDSYRTISPFGDAGALLLYAALGGFLLYRWTGMADASALRRAASRTVSGALATSIGIVAMLGMALAMTDSGMTFVLARGLVDVAGPLYPLASPFVGLLGAFMTGSNTSSNILFTTLQRDAALLLALPPSLLLATQTTGGALGSMLAPAKVILGCSTVGLGGREGPVMRQGVIFGLSIAFAIGLFAVGWSAVR
jgi:lactate permease